MRRVLARACAIYFRGSRYLMASNGWLAPEYHSPVDISPPRETEH